MRRAALLALALLTGCGQEPSQDDPAPNQPATAVSVASPPPSASGSPAPSPSTSRDPQEVLTGWARAIASRDWPLVRAYWGEKGERSGLSPQQFAHRWDSLLTPKVSFGEGSQEGAAGSVYYTAPVTIADGPRRLSGEVVLRRVNDVPGATPEQLRWHIEATTVVP